jgi:hypothetical protein
MLYANSIVEKKCVMYFNLHTCIALVYHTILADLRYCIILPLRINTVRVSCKSTYFTSVETLIKKKKKKCVRI